MAKDRRILVNGVPADFSCFNARFKTNLAKGEAHGNYPTKGSVFKTHLVAYNGGSLWLEHVEDVEDPSGTYYWLMHYDNAGIPTIPLSAIISKDELQTMASLMASLIP